jgi:20S proteasome alpha/beta subunit
VQFDGTLRDANAYTVLGAEEDEISESLADRVDDGMDLKAAVKAACGAIESATGQSVEDESWESGFLDRSADRRAFRRLTTSEIGTARS